MVGFGFSSVLGCALLLCSCLGAGGGGGGSGDGASGGGGGDCREAAAACATGFTCVEAPGAWECVPNDNGPGGDGDAPTGDGDGPGGDGDAPAGDGDAPAGDGDAPAGDGDGDAAVDPCTEFELKCNLGCESATGAGNELLAEACVLGREANVACAVASAQVDSLCSDPGCVDALDVCARCTDGLRDDCTTDIAMLRCSSGLPDYVALCP